jgi:hypothetical protein
MTLKVSVQIRPVQMEPDGRLPPGRKFGFLLHDYDLYGFSRPSRNEAGRAALGPPQTAKVLQPVFMPITEPWQHYWADLFSLSLFDKLYNQLAGSDRDAIEQAFRSVTKGDRAFTNKHGWDNGYADYINGENTSADPMEQETINCGGNVVELLSDVIQVGGRDAYQVATLDGSRPPPDPLVVNHCSTPWLIFKATISRREGFDPRTGHWAREDIVIPFAQLQSHDVPIPFMGNGAWNYIDAGRIRVLPEASPLPDPYRR